jgi:hypothetical protein
MLLTWFFFDRFESAASGCPATLSESIKKVAADGEVA